MNLVLTVLEIVAPVFILAGVGFGWVKLGFEYRLQFVTRLAVTLALPCLLFTALMKIQIDPAALGTLSLATLAAYAAVTAVMYIVAKIGRLDIRAYLAPLIFGNTGNLGLPLALFAFGDVGLGYAVIVFALMMIYSFTFGLWVVAGGGNPLGVLKEPAMWATVLGVTFMLLGWSTPTFLTNALELIGQMTIPLMLITLGVALGRLKVVSLSKAIWLSLIKAGVCAAIAVTAGMYFALPPVAFAVLTLQLMTPVAVTSYLMAEKYGADSDAVAGLVVTSTLISVAALPVALGFLI